MNDKNKNILAAASPRRLFYMATLFLAAATVAVNLGQGRVFWQTLARGRWWWVVLASCLQLVFLLNQSALYTMIYRMFKLPARLGHFFLLVISTAFVSAVVPGGTLSGSGLILYDAQAKRLDFARSLLANLVYYLFDYLAFLIILALALCYLLNRGSLKEYEIIAAIILVVVIAVLSLLLVLIAKRPASFSVLTRRLLHQTEHLPLPWKLAGKIPELESKMDNFIGQLSSALHTITCDRTALFLATVHALLVEGIGLLQLQALFLAFNQNPGAGRLITGYAIGVLFMIVSITPQGVGLMEGAMTAAYTSLGIPLEQAIMVTFIYRGLSFWLPMFCGSLSLKRLVAEW